MQQEPVIENQKPNEEVRFALRNGRKMYTDEEREQLKVKPGKPASSAVTKKESDAAPLHHKNQIFSNYGDEKTPR